MIRNYIKIEVGNSNKTNSKLYRKVVDLLEANQIFWSEEEQDDEQ